jgi:hypothetical protein
LTSVPEPHALAPQIGHRLDARALLDHQVNALRVEVGDHAQIGHAGLALKNAGSVVGPGGHVGLRKARLHRPAHDAVDIGHRTVGRLRGHHDLAGLAHRIGDHATDWVIGASGTARPDAKELLRLRAHRHSGAKAQGQQKTARCHG